ncbi:MAG: hypothetical protein AAGG01_10835 [Planctomycetota bacterium]
MTRTTSLFHARTNRRSLLKLASTGASAGLCGAVTANESTFDLAARPYQPLRVLGMGDPQIGCPFGDWARNVPAAMADIQGLDHDLHVVVGDLVQNDASYYLDYESLILQQSPALVHSLAGNGDVGAGLGSYYAATGFSDLHHAYLRGIRLIYLGTTFMSPPPPGNQHICHLGPAQLEEFAELLAADTTTTTLVFGHAPIQDTTFRSSFQSDLKEMWLAESAEVQRLFDEYANVVFYGSGHVHYDYGVVDAFGQDGWHVDRGRGVIHHSIGDACTGHGSTVIEVFPDGIRLRVRDHQSGQGRWRPAFERWYPLFTTLV